MARAVKLGVQIYRENCFTFNSACFAELSSPAQLVSTPRVEPLLSAGKDYGSKDT
jgi:hypothetical protein